MSRLICIVNDKIVAQTMEKLNTNSIKEDEHIHEALKQNRDYQRPDFSKSEKEEQVKESAVDHDSMLADSNLEIQDMISGKPTSSLKLEEDKSQNLPHSNDRRTIDEFTDTVNKDSKNGIESVKSDSKSETDSDFDHKGLSKDTNSERETIKRESGNSDKGAGGKDTSLSEDVMLKHCSSDCVPDLTVDEHDEAVTDDVKMEDPAVDKTKSSNKVEWTLDDTEPGLKVRPKQTTVHEYHQCQRVLNPDCFVSVSKGAKTRNGYNQVPHLTKDTNGKVANSQLDTTNESQEVSTFQVGDYKAHINRHSQRHSKHKTEKT